MSNFKGSFQQQDELLWSDSSLHMAEIWRIFVYPDLHVRRYLDVNFNCICSNTVVNIAPAAGKTYAKAYA